LACPVAGFKADEKNYLFNHHSQASPSNNKFRFAQNMQSVLGSVEGE
jgi:hypothetical protein